MERLLKKFETAQGARAAAGRCARRRAQTRFGVDLLRLDQPGDAARRSTRSQAHGIHVDALRAARIPVRRQRGAVHRRARARVRRRAEPRRPAAHAAGQRVRASIRRGCAGAALRRHADHRALHHRGDRRARARRQASQPIAQAPPRRQPHDLHRQAAAAPSRRCETNKVGYTRRDYEGKISTLCAGCGHDSISAAHHPGLLGARHRAAPRRQALGHRLQLEDAGLLPRRLARLQHRARPHAVGADRRQPRQPRPALPRRLAATATRPRSASASSRTRCGAACNMAYIVENNGVYGLTKGQFSATADQGSKSKKGVVNSDSPIDLVAHGAAARRDATSARSFSGDKEQLVPLIKGAHQPPRRGASSTSSAPASRSTTTPAAPRATTTCASTTRRSTASTSCRAATRSRRCTRRAR